MTNRSPPLNALRAFEVAARHLSFSKAAEELQVTPAAISHHIKTLESSLEMELFYRLNRGLELTWVGRAVFPKLQEGFACFAEAVKLARRYDSENMITIWSTPSFAAKWLVPRLNRFNRRYPGLDLRINADLDMESFRLSPDSLADELRRHGVDVAIVFGDYRPCSSCRLSQLLPVSLVPLCSPRLMEGEHSLTRPENLRHHRLIHADAINEGQPDWRVWLETAQIEGVDLSHGSHFNDTALALEAAVDGQGVVLGPEPLATDDLAAGRLVIPFDVRLPLKYGYSVLYPNTIDDQPMIRGFLRWLVREAERQVPGTERYRGRQTQNHTAAMPITV
jgi:LysR family glycine cleavage system transcriptional activator